MNELIAKLGIAPGLSLEETAELLKEKNGEYLERIQSCQDEKRKQELLKVQAEIEQAIDSLSMGISLVTDTIKQSKNNGSAAVEGQKSVQDRYHEGFSYFKEQKYDKAIEIMLPFANQGDLAAQLVCAYSNLHSGFKHEAKRWFFCAADQGDGDAMYMMAALYYEEKNVVSAEEWAQKAINKNGSIYAYKLLAKMKGDSMEAYRLLREALKNANIFEGYTIVQEMNRHLTDMIAHLALHGGLPEIMKLINSLMEQSSNHREKAMLNNHLDACHRKIEENGKKKEDEKKKARAVMVGRLKLLAIGAVVILIIRFIWINAHNQSTYVYDSFNRGLGVHIPRDAKGDVTYPSPIFFKPVVDLIADYLDATSISLGDDLDNVSISKSPKISSITAPAALKFLRLSEMDGLKTIDFSKCESLNEVTISTCKTLDTIDFGKVKNIGTLAIEKCESLNTIDLGRMESISKLSISGCPSMDSFTFNTKSDSLTLGGPNINKIAWGDKANVKEFQVYGLNNLPSLDFPGGLEKLDVSGCNGITALDIPEGTTNLSLVDNTRLAKLTLHVPAEKMTGFGVARCDSLKTVYVPAVAVDGYKQLFAKWGTDNIDARVLPIQ